MPPAHPTNALTRREREIVLLICAGLPTRAVAARLFMSPRTAEWHLGSVYRKLGVENRCQLMRHALGHGLLTQAHGTPEGPE